MRRARFHRLHESLPNKKSMWGFLIGTIIMFAIIIIVGIVSVYVLCLDTCDDCSDLDSDCSSGVCKDGKCEIKHLNRSCDDKLYCTTDDKCVDGKCVGVENPCWDNNPCTYNKCVEGTGCMLQQQDVGICNSTCSKTEDCPGLYTCADGTCVLLDDKGSTIRFIDYNLDNCPSGKRLVMDFILETIPYTIGNDTRFILPLYVTDFTSDGVQPLGFIDEVTNLDAVHVNNTVRIGFTLSTECQVFTPTNCATIFSFRNYKFFINLHHCLSVHNHEHCLTNTKTNIGASIDLSIYDCTEFSQSQEIQIRGEALIFDSSGNQMIPPFESPLGDTRITVGFRSDVYTNPTLRAVTTAFRICTPKENHRLSDCVLGLNPDCIVSGCFNWDLQDYPIERYYDVVYDGITPIAKTEMDVASCYDESVYLNNSCFGNKCPDTTTGINLPWVAIMDDGFHLSTNLLQNKEWTFDFKFKIYICNNRRRLNEEKEYHNILSINI